MNSSTHGHGARGQPRPRDRVSPCLLDKLLLSEGKLPLGSPTMSLTNYIESVSRDLTDLLSQKAPAPNLRLFISSRTRVTGQHDVAPDALTLEDFPEAANSVITFGLPELAGLAQADLDLTAMERLLEKKIRFFEPRFDPNTLRVQVLPFADHEAARLRFKVEGDLWAFPRNESVDLTAEIDLINSQCNVTS